MTAAEQAIECIEAAGGLLAVHGERIRCRLPEDAAHLLEELLVHRDEVLLVLHQRDDVPAMPAGVRLVRWKLKEAPLLIETGAVVTDPALFATTTLRQLQIVLKNPKRWVGWTVPQLIERLAQVGVVVTLSSEEETQ